jgi:hypothetical protein
MVFVVIDHDEAAVVATQQSAYQAVQEAFPPLHCNIDKSNNTRVGDTVGTDEKVLAHIFVPIWKFTLQNLKVTLRGPWDIAHV